MFKQHMHAPPRGMYPRSKSNDVTSMDKFIPCLIITKSPLLIQHAKKHNIQRLIMNMKDHYSRLDPLVRSFVKKGAFDEGNSYYFFTDNEFIGVGQGTRTIQYIIDKSTGVGLSFSTNNKTANIMFSNAEPGIPDIRKSRNWLPLSDRNSDFLYLASLYYTLEAIKASDSKLNEMRTLEKERMAALARYGT